MWRKRGGGGRRGGREKINEASLKHSGKVVEKT